MTAATMEMQERVGPSRPSRLGTRRRSRKGATTSAGRRAPSLDTDKQLQTSPRNCAEWLNDQMTEGELYRRQIRLHSELLSSYHTLWQDYAEKGEYLEAVKWEKKWLRLYNCRNEWVGYRAECCKSQTTPLAVPIGCNDRLCPLCAWDRSRVARKRVKTLFDKLTHPVLITLTVPNSATLRKHDFTLFRQRVRTFIAEHKAWIKGGVYAIETTYNRAEKSWHVHAHVLADVASPLPAKTEKVELAGRRTYLFTAMKLRLEFDWLRLWGTGWGKGSRKNASANKRAGDAYSFDQWVMAGRENTVRVWDSSAKRYVVDASLSAHIVAKRTAWNRANRRVIDLRAVTDRDGAAREVLKYITKVADFGDAPEAVEAFANAVRGARLVQTFGSWYGVKLEAPATHADDWGELKCACGCNEWRRMGVFYRRDVCMDSDGRWRLTHQHNYQSSGTVPRPTIRALDEREE